MDFDKVKDSGKRQEFKSGAVRDTQTGKGRYDLLPTRAIRRLAKHYENGAVKYGGDNWLKGMPMRRMADSALRHLLQALEGKTDEDHWIACAWNVLGIVEYQERIEEDLLPKELNDLPKINKKSIKREGLFKIIDDIKSKLPDVTDEEIEKAVHNALEIIRNIK